MTKLEDTMHVIKTHGELLRYPGGFWSYALCPMRKPTVTESIGVLNIPMWYVRPEVIMQLLYQGRVRATDFSAGFARRVVPYESH